MKKSFIYHFSPVISVSNANILSKPGVKYSIEISAEFFYINRLLDNIRELIFLIHFTQNNTFMPFHKT